MRVSVSYLQPGMVLSHNIYSDDGLLLLGADTALSASYIARLSDMGIGSVNIRTTCLECPEAQDIITHEVRRQTVSAVRGVFTKFQATKKIDVGVVYDNVKSIVSQVVQNPNALIHMHDIRSYDNYTFGHCVNVGILSTLVGVKLGYDEWQLRQLALGGVLHDIGKMLIPKQILHKPSKLDDQEMQEMQKHTELGFDILRKQGETIPLLSSHVAYQHHEKFDGSGYCRGLGGMEIHEFARIAAIADVFDALISDRPYRQGMLPHEAYEIIQSLSGRQFDPKILEIFVRRIALYPPGTVVQLNSGYVGIVTKVDQGLATRPFIQLILDEYGKRCISGQTIDLTKELTTFITKVYDAKETIELDRRLSLQSRKV